MRTNISVETYIDDKSISKSFVFISTNGFHRRSVYLLRFQKIAYSYFIEHVSCLMLNQLKPCCLISCCLLKTLLIAPLLSLKLALCSNNPSLFAYSKGCLKFLLMSSHLYVPQACLVPFTEAWVLRIKFVFLPCNHPSDLCVFPPYHN